MDITMVLKDLNLHKLGYFPNNYGEMIHLVKLHPPKERSHSPFTSICHLCSYFFGTAHHLNASAQSATE
jgi:hypothetical protein